MSHAVIGMGFGDEGKGLMTDFLASESSIKLNPYLARNKMVVRYSGGQQAGHTVTIGDQRHVFSTFGSGTLRGVPTFWSHFCTVDPVEIVREMNILKDVSDEIPILFIDPNCPVTTPTDKVFQQGDKENLSNGTCGFGVGTTFQREEDFYHLLARDIWNPTVLKMKYEQINKSYYHGTFSPKEEMEKFYEACETIRNSMTIKLRQFDSLEGHHLIFEGSQGLLLDQHIGFFPNVTRSNTGTRNILQMGYRPEITLVTRAYQTRHGNGPMTNLKLNDDYYIAEDDRETNVNNDFQGEFRRSMLDLDLLYHGISTDPYIARLKSDEVNLCVTCLDHLDDDFCFTLEGEKYIYKTPERFVEEIGKVLGIQNRMMSMTPESKNVVIL